MERKQTLQEQVDLKLVLDVSLQESSRDVLASSGVITFGNTDANSLAAVATSCQMFSDFSEVSLMSLAAALARLSPKR